MVGHISNLTPNQLCGDAVKNAAMNVMVGGDEGWQDHVMRILELGVDGYSPKHKHPWPHINYIIEGEGSLMIEGVDHPLSAGSYAFVPDNALHQFKNTGTAPLKFICIVPNRGHK